MDTLGSEVGQKMRAAIKAKLNELGCYVDDELPDYVMVMVANKRSRMQMEDDLQLFLGARTEVFVYWLHQVLQKLQEVKIPPIGSSTEGLKSSTESTELTVKKERKDKRHKKSKKDEKHRKSVERRPSPSLSLESDDSNLKITDLLANQLLETVKSKTNSLEENIKTEQQSKTEKIIEKISPLDKDNHNTDEFDIPTISEIEKESSKLTEKLSEITEIDQKIENARLELEVLRSDSDEDVINISNDGEELSDIEEPKLKLINKPKIEQEKTVEPPSTTPPRKPMSERLGQKCVKTAPTIQNRVKNILNLNTTEKPSLIKQRKPLNRNSESLKTRESNNKNTKNSIHSRLGNRPSNLENNRISSKIIAIPPSEEVYEESASQVSVPSIIKVKPRPQLPAGIQANKNLLLKAMAEARKSVEQNNPRPSQVIQRKPVELYTKKFRNENRKQISYGRRNDMRITVNADEIDCSFEENSMEYTPEPVLNISTDSSSGFLEYIPSLISKNDILAKEKKIEETTDLAEAPEQTETVMTPQFVVTLDGLDTSQFPSRKRKLEALQKSPKKPNLDPKLLVETQKLVIQKLEDQKPKIIEKRKHTPIVFDKKDLEKEVKPNSSSEILDSESELMERVNDTVKVIINDEEDLKIGAVVDKTVKLKETQSKYDHIPAVLSEVPKKERCKFFPSCRLGDSCEFLHPAPTVPCKAFPACKFGASCLYLHPRCKFDQDCIRKRDCPYSHSNGVVQVSSTPVLTNTLSSTVSVVPNAVAAGGFKSSGVTGAMCRFYPHCSNPQCMFYHPKMCRFGKYCHNKGECNFYHPEVLSKEKFVWKPAAASTAT